MLRRPFRLLAGSIALLLSGCAAAAPPPPPAAGQPLSVVASTNVWAAVAQAVGGEQVTVTSILTDPSADPHSFEASPRVKLAMSSAALVIVNGGGYDDWAVDTVSAIEPRPRVLDAVETSGLDSASPDFNEHVFYDLDAVAAVAQAIAKELGAAAPEQLKTFTANADALGHGLAALQADVRALGAAHPGINVLATEPLPGYLIRLFGFTDVTPAGFSAAVEADVEVSVKDLNTTSELISAGTVRLFFSNTQTAGPVTDQLVATARAVGVPVVGVTETLPEGTADYLTWMRSTLDSVAAALG